MLDTLPSLSVNGGFDNHVIAPHRASIPVRIILSKTTKFSVLFITIKLAKYKK